MPNTARPAVLWSCNGRAFRLLTLLAPAAEETRAYGPVRARAREVAAYLSAGLAAVISLLLATLSVPALTYVLSRKLVF